MPKSCNAQANESTSSLPKLVHIADHQKDCHTSQREHERHMCMSRYVFSLLDLDLSLHLRAHCHAQKEKICSRLMFILGLAILGTLVHILLPHVCRSCLAFWDTVMTQSPTILIFCSGVIGWFCICPNEVSQNYFGITSEV